MPAVPAVPAMQFLLVWCAPSDECHGEWVSGRVNPETVWLRRSVVSL